MFCPNAEISVMDALIGRYDFVRGENVDEYLVGLGVGLVLRKVHSVAKPELQIQYSAEENEWKIRYETVFHRHVLKAKVGVEVEEDETFDVRECKTTLQPSECGTKLVMHQRCEEGPDVKTVFQKLANGHIFVEMTSGEFTAFQYFEVSNSPPKDNDEDPGEIEEEEEEDDDDD